MGQIDLRKHYLGKLAKLHGVPVMESPYVNEPTLLIPNGFLDELMKEEIRLIGL